MSVSFFHGHVIDCCNSLMHFSGDTRTVNPHLHQLLTPPWPLAVSLAIIAGTGHGCEEGAEVKMFP